MVILLFTLLYWGLIFWYLATRNWKEIIQVLRYAVRRDGFFTVGLLFGLPILLIAFGSLQMFAYIVVNFLGP